MTCESACLARSLRRSSPAKCASRPSLKGSSTFVQLVPVLNVTYRLQLEQRPSLLLSATEPWTHQGNSTCGLETIFLYLSFASLLRYYASLVIYYRPFLSMLVPFSLSVTLSFILLSPLFVLFYLAYDSFRPMYPPNPLVLSTLCLVWHVSRVIPPLYKA